MSSKKKSPKYQAKKIRQRWTKSEEERFAKYEKLYYQKRITIKEICQQFPKKTKSQVFSHMHKKKYRTKKNFGIFCMSSKQEELKEIINQVRQCQCQNVKKTQEFIQFYDKLRNKSILISKEILKELININYYGDNSTVLITESILKTITLKLFFKKIMLNHIEKDKKYSFIFIHILLRQNDNIFVNNNTMTNEDKTKTFNCDLINNDYFYIQELQIEQYDSYSFFDELNSFDENKTYTFHYPFQ